MYLLWIVLLHITVELHGLIKPHTFWRNAINNSDKRVVLFWTELSSNFSHNVLSVLFIPGCSFRYNAPWFLPLKAAFLINFTWRSGWLHFAAVLLPRHRPPPAALPSPPGRISIRRTSAGHILKLGLSWYLQMRSEIAGKLPAYYFQSLVGAAILAASGAVHVMWQDGGSPLGRPEEVVGTEGGAGV